MLRLFCPGTPVVGEGSTWVGTTAVFVNVGRAVGEEVRVAVGIIAVGEAVRVAVGGTRDVAVGEAAPLVAVGATVVEVEVAVDVAAGNVGTEPNVMVL